MTKIRIVTHSGGFHADDVFGVATLQLLLAGNEIEVIRTRDPETIQSGDYVLDVGGVYNPVTYRFDHHQTGGAGKRENGIPYASVGLIWKAFGAQVCSSQEVADDIETRLIQTIDAFDNGMDTYTATMPGVYPYIIPTAMFAFTSLGADTENFDSRFSEAVAWVTVLLKKEIVSATNRVAVFASARKSYEAAPDKTLVVCEGKLSREVLMEAFQKYPDVIYFIKQHADGTWQVVCAVDDVHVYKNRKDLPASWAGKHDSELVDITGVPDAVFCHSGLFMAVTKTKEGAIKLAQLALSA